MNFEVCPACGNRQAKHLHNHHHNLSMGLSAPPKNFQSSYYQCANCSHIFYLSSELTEEDLYRHYKVKPSPSLGEYSSADQNAVERIAGILSSVLSNFDDYHIRKILEIGGADGHFLSVLSKLDRFKYAELFLHDYSEDCSELAIKREISVISDININEPYDLIIFRHTLEHIISPLSFLSDIYDKLSSNGLIYLEVPSWVLPFGKTDNYNPEHIQQFNQRSMHWLLARSGFNVRYDFTTYFDNYGTTSNRLMGVVAEKSKPADLSIFSGDCFQGFEARYQLERQSKIDLLSDIKKLLDGMSNEHFVIVFHAASVSLTDFLQNEGKILNLSRIIITDGDSKKHGIEFMGKRVQSPTSDLAYKAQCVFCFSSYHESIRSHWLGLGFKGRFIACA